MIVVSNTSPLTNLAAIGQLELLHRLYDELHIADGVWHELNAGGVRWPGRDEVGEAEWIQRHFIGPEPLVASLTRDLDQGEAETIALAIKLGADLVLLDEREDGAPPSDWGFKSLASSVSSFRRSGWEPL